MFHRVIELEPRSYTARIELGNYALKRQDTPAAVAWYRGALEDALPQFRSNIAEQIAKLVLRLPPFRRCTIFCRSRSPRNRLRMSADCTSVPD